MSKISIIFLLLLFFISTLHANLDETFPYSKIGENLFKIEVDGNSIIASIGSDGVLLCDIGGESKSPRIKATIEKLGGKNIDYIIDTHWHADHSGGNIVFGKNAIIIAHENTKKRLAKNKILKFWEEEHPAFPEYALPEIIFSDRMTLNFNGDEINLIHLPDGHTDGDIIVYFKNSNILHVGDCIFSIGFPAIDFENGGNVEGFANNLKRITEMMPNDVKIIVSHGPDYTIVELLEYEKMIRSSLKTIQKAMKNNMDLVSMQEANILDEWKEFSKGFLNCNEWIHIIYQSLLYQSNPEVEMKTIYFSERREFYGQISPGMKPEIFAPGILSTNTNEFNAVFTQSGDKVYFTVTSETGQDIMVIKKKNGLWQKRQLASFSDPHRDVDPFITHDGTRLYFSSNRPIKRNKPQEDCDFWFVEKLDSGEWGEAQHLDYPCTPKLHDFYYVSSWDGSIYFSIFEKSVQYCHHSV